MISFDPVLLKNNEYKEMKELTYKNALKVSVIDKKFNEKRLSEFLRQTVSSVDPILLSGQERYYILLKYLEKQKNTLLETSIIDKINNCFINDVEWIEDITKDGVYLRHLIGRDLEYLESVCLSSKEWFACAMAFQLDYSDRNILPELPNRDDSDSKYFEVFKKRLDVIQNSGLSDFDKFYNDYIKLNYDLKCLLDLSFGNEGILVRGADDALIRFRPSTTFTGLIKELDR